jgi:hypothetical protein
MKRLFALALLTAACGSATVTNPSNTVSPVNLAGTWTGSANSNVAGAGTVDATISQSAQTLSGSWSVRYPNAAYNNSGSLSGSIQNSTVSLALSSSIATPCPYSVNGMFATASGRTTITGTFTTVNCATPQNGAFTISR